MQHGEHAADNSVAKPCEPAGLAGRQFLEVAAQQVEEHQLGEPGEDAVRPRPVEAHLLSKPPGKAVEPAVGHCGHVQSPGQRREEWVERSQVAAEKSADERRGR
jgi:hypothetical protein